MRAIPSRILAATWVLLLCSCGSDASQGNNKSGSGGKSGAAGMSGRSKTGSATGEQADAAVVGSGSSRGVHTSQDPVIPPVSGDCPVFQSGTTDFSGLGGILLEVGPKADGTGSLIFYWHGTGSVAAEVDRTLPAEVRQEIMDQGGIIVSPQTSGKQGGDCSGTSTFSMGDFVIADQIAACAIRDYNIDPHRIYTTGCSAGGLQAGCMATMRSDYIAAAVTNSGGIVFTQPLQSSSHTPALMTMHGGTSDMVIVYFSDTSKTLDDQFKMAGGFVINCNHGGGHCQAPPALQSAGWQFMKDHPFGVDPEPYAMSLPSSFPSYCMSY
jgi:predicted esterase